MNIILKAQFNRQLAFPFKEFVSQHKTTPGDVSPVGQVIPYAGKIGDEWYWVCNECHKPIIGKDGKPINRKEDILEFIEQDVSVEKKTKFPMQAEIKLAESLFNKFYSQIASVVKNHLEEFSSPDDGLYTVLTNLRTVIEQLIIPIEKQLEIIWQKTFYALLDKLGRENMPLSPIAIRVIFSFQPGELEHKAIVIWNTLTGGTEPRNWGNIRKIPQILNMLETEIIGSIKDSCKPFIDYINFVKNYTELQTIDVKNEKRLFPLCNECGEGIRYYCQYEDCNFYTTDEDEIIEVETATWRNGRRKVTSNYYCKEHADNCEICGKGLLTDDNETVSHDGDYYHGDCFSEHYSCCGGCNEYFYSEDMQYDEDTGDVYCPACYDDVSDRSSGTEEDLDRKEKEEAETLIGTFPKLYPIDEKTIEASILPILQLAYKKLQSKPMDWSNFSEFVQKRLQKNEAKAAVISEISRLSPDVDWRYAENTITADELGKVIESFKTQLEEMRRFKQEYPNLKGYKPLPVNVSLQRSRMGHEGSVFALYPTKEFLVQAEKIQPGAYDAYNKYIKNKGHHSGALGYARFSVSDGRIVIDNLQTDIDVQGFSETDLENPALRWWVSSIKKFWAPFLLDALRRFGKQIEKEVYLTTFEMQKQKWRSLPDRNKDVYDRIPEIMGFEEEDVSVKPEDLKKKTWTMRRVAKSLDIGAFAYYKLCTG